MDIVERKLLNKLYQLQSLSAWERDAELRAALELDIVHVLTLLKLWRDAAKDEGFPHSAIET